MNQSLADVVRDSGCRAIAVSNAYILAPWADALVSNDQAWWKEHPDAMNFAGRKFCGMAFRGAERLHWAPIWGTSCNSGLQGMRVAYEIFNATRLLLLGFDMRGAHFFGRHPSPLRNTTPQQFAKHIAQFDRWRGCEVINCTPGSALKRFPYADFREVINSMRLGVTHASNETTV